MTFPYIEKGNRLRKIIEDTNLTQTKFAEKIGISQGYLTQVINGYKDLSGTILEGVAIHYGNTYNILWLLTGRGTMLESDHVAVKEAQNVEEEKPQYLAEPGKILLSDLPEMFREMVEDVKRIRKILENKEVHQ